LFLRNEEVGLQFYLFYLAVFLKRLYLGSHPPPPALNSRELLVPILYSN
jgi:hypothetical protein